MEYEDLFKMITDILDYVGKYPGSVIICKDLSTELLLGFTLKDVDPPLLSKPYWYIRLRNYKVSLNKEGVSPRVRECLNGLFSTEYGRRSLAELLTKGQKPPELEEAT